MTLCPKSWMAALGLLFWLLTGSGVASAQSVQLSRTSLSFPNQAVGTTSSSLNVILTNTDGITPLTISGITASGDYSESDNCAGSVAPSGNCTLLITFMPNSAGTLTGVITLSDDANNSPQLITTKGTGVVPLTVAPTSLPFGSVTVGVTSAAKTVTLTNDLNTSVTFSFTTSGDYAAIGSGTNPCGTSLIGHATCTLSVTFSPKTNGSINGALTVTQTVDSILQIVALSGSGTGGQTPPLSFSPTSLSFPSTAVGATSAGKTVVVTNNSSSTVTISSFPASTDYVSAPGNASPCGGALTAGDQCTVTVTFSPTQAGTIKGSVTFSDNATINRQILDLSGTAIAPVSVSPASLAFATQQLGTTSAPKTVTITNHQNTTLAIDSITPSGDYGTVAIGTNPCGSTLPELTSCTIGVTFSPIGRTGTIPGDLTVSSNASSSPQIVKLTGTTSGLLPRFAYVANSADGTVSEYTVNLSTGQLRENGYVFAGTGPDSVAVAPSGKFAYVANGFSNNISAYTVNASTGALTPITGSPFTTGDGPVSLTVGPSGKFVYAANSGPGNISVYAIDGATGALTPVTGSPFTAGEDPNSVVVSPSGKFAYVANQGPASADISAYTVDATTGALTPVDGSPFPFPSSDGGRPTSAAVNPAGNFLYVTSNNDSDVAAYSINATTGALTLVSGSPFSVASDAASLTIAPSGKFAYIAGGDGTSVVSAFNINAATGALTPVTSSPFAAGINPSSVTVDPTGTLLYVTNQGSNDVWAYAINAASGALTLLKTVRTQRLPSSIFLSTGTTPVTYTPRFAYVANFGAATVSAYTIDYTGALTAVAGSPFPAGSGPGPYSVTVDPSGKFAYVANTDDADVLAYTINATTGALTAVSGSPFPTGPWPASVTVDPSAKFAYVANSLFGDDVSAYTINATTGALTQITGSPFAAGSLPQSVTVDPSGKFAYVANYGDKTVSAYTINATTGALTQITGSPFAAGSQPYSVTVDPSGKFAYVANDGASDVSAYTINATTGALTQITGSPFPAESNPVSVTVDPSGKFAYVANSYDSDVSAYTINATTGALAAVSGSPFPAGAQPNSVTTTGIVH
jgi:6-phosphogluconolactonase (cycloisomerase 2 family)